MAFCEQCGNQLNENTKFCGKCGTPVTSPVTAGAGQTEPPPVSSPPAVPVDEESPAKKAFKAGMACQEAERYDEAIVHYTEVIRLAPESTGAYYYRGVLYNIKGDNIRAIADLNEAVRLTPDGVNYHARGVILFEKGDYDAALADFTKAIQLLPDDAENYGYRGTIYAMKGDLALARTDLEQGLRIDPNEEMLVQLSGYFEEMSAPSACTQCGTPLEAGEAFCSNCGAKVGVVQNAVPQYQPTPVQAQRQAKGERVLKEGYCTGVKINGVADIAYSLNEAIKANKAYTDEGKLILYCDRLEWWKGPKETIVVPIVEISSVKLGWFNNIKIVTVYKKSMSFIRFFCLAVRTRRKWHSGIIKIQIS